MSNRTRYKALIRQQLDLFLKKFGYKMVRLRPPLRTAKDLANVALSDLSSAFVIDVGAANGDFTQEVLEIVPDAEVICVDPIQKHYQLLSQRFATRKVHVEQIALGEFESTVVFHETAHPHSSSLLAPGKHREHFPTASSQTIEYPVQVKRLEKLLENDRHTSIDLIKIDTQGYELPVLMGTGKKLDICRYLIVEMSLCPLYEKQAAFDETIDFLRQQGFQMIDYAEGARSHVTGEILQLDILYQHR